METDAGTVAGTGDAGEETLIAGGADPSGGEGSEDSKEGSSEEGKGLDYVALAKEAGWREDFDGPAALRMTPEEFVKQKPLRDKVHNQRSEIKRLEKVVEAMARHYDMTIKQAKERTIRELTQQRRESIEMGKVAEVEEIDSQIANVRRMVDPVVPSPSLDPEIQDFVAEQKWFNTDQDMTAFAVAYHESYLRRNPGDMKKSLQETLKAVKKAYPDKFENPRKSAPGAVEGAGSSKQQGEGKYAMHMLDEYQRKAYNQFVKVHKTMTHDEYFKSLEEAGYLEVSK